MPLDPGTPPAESECAILPRVGALARALAAAAVALVPAWARAAPAWDVLCPGIEVARFDACPRSAFDDSKITVVRVAPSQAGLRLMSAADLHLPGPLRVEEWAEQYDLAVVINGGMFAEDWRTHLGY